jgi:hypothetical protein
LTNCGLTNDIISSGTSFVGSTSRGNSSSSVGVYIDTGKTLVVNGSFLGASTIFWGPGTLNVAGNARFQYSSTAVANLLCPLQLNGGTTAHSIFTLANVDTPCGGITLTAAALDAASSATCATTGFGGLAFNPGGASLTTGGL